MEVKVYFKKENLSESAPIGCDLSGIISRVLSNSSDRDDYCFKNGIVAALVDGEVKDLSFIPNCDCEIELIRMDSDVGLEIIRHDAAHVLAKAVKNLFPNVRLGIGPAIKNGFYYDFALDEVTFSTEILPKIEEEMSKIISKKEKFERIILFGDEARTLFKSLGEVLKIEILNNISPGSEITAYKNGDFYDLCKGPHSPHTGYIKAFKLTGVSGAYWKGDSKGESLQRIYGTAWGDQKSLRAHILFLEEVKKRDHRKISKDMDLCHIQDEAAGQVFWHERGWKLYRIVEDYMRKKLESNGYFEVKTPALLNKSFWEKSGHWEKFKDDMFIVGTDRALKPMSCPCHIQIFNLGSRSYRDLPIRMAEFGCCFRNESSGALYGLMRVRNFVQDDAHIFCTEDQVVSETVSFVNLLFEVYSDFGFKNVSVKFSDRPEIRAGDDEIWDKAENALSEAVKSTGLKFDLNKGEGAFYGPKLEFVLEDAIGREWQCGTLQVDFVLPERLDASYMDSSGKKRRPVILHRAVLGTFERFIGILLEHTCGRLPLWLSPVQVVVIPVDETVSHYVNKIFRSLSESGIRFQIDFDSEKVGYRLRKHSIMKVPVIWVIGASEVETLSVSERRLGSSDVAVLALEQAINRIIVELC